MRCIEAVVVANLVYSNPPAERILTKHNMWNATIDDSAGSMQKSSMGRPKQFEERIQLTLIEGTTAAIDGLLAENEYRLDFIRAAIDAEIQKRKSQKNLDNSQV